MTDEPAIRPAISSDVESIKKIAGSTGLFPPAMLDDMIAGYLDGSTRDIWLAAVDEGTTIGFVFSEPERMASGTWNMLAIGVLPSHQGRRIGAKLVAAIEQRLRSNGERVLLVETMGTPEFERTRDFYRARNYAEEARIRDFYDAGQDKIVFWKKL